VTGDTAIVSPTGLTLAVLSGAIASGLAYAAWYSVLPHIAAWRAALLQLTVPVITALAAVVVLSEPMTSRLLLALALVIGGIALTARGRQG
jgi:drug/metabolite transporter (DMT)-like permease